MSSHLLLSRPSSPAVSAVTHPPSSHSLPPSLTLHLNPAFVLWSPSSFHPSVFPIHSVPLPPFVVSLSLSSPLCLSFASNTAICLGGGGEMQERDATQATGNHGNECSLSKCRPHQCWITLITAFFPSFFQPFFSLHLSPLILTRHQPGRGRKKTKKKQALLANTHSSQCSSSS